MSGGPTSARLALVLAVVWTGVVFGGDPREQAPAAVVAPPQTAAPAGPTTDEEIESFLERAKIVRHREAGKGVTNSIRATLSDGTFTHDAHIQTIDEYKREFRGALTMELDFRDSWTFNIAAYRLDRMMGLHMVPVSVEGRFRSNPAAITWWVDDIVMDEGHRSKKKILPPPEKARWWSEQLSLMRMFDQLIYNTDRNQGNMLIDTDWRLWLIDHTRAFRKHTKLQSPNQVARSDRAVLDRLRTLDAETLKARMERYLDSGQVRALLERRDLIVARLEARGPGALFERPSATAP